MSTVIAAAASQALQQGLSKAQVSAALKLLHEKTTEPLPKPGPGLALCLSGGGSRAALFHLGALRRLNELGILSRIDFISSVSGGSILAAHLARRLNPWPAPGQSYPRWEEELATPFRKFAAQDIRTCPILKRLLPWNWFKSDTSVEALARVYERQLGLGTLAELPQRPEFIFCATDLVFGVNWEFRRTRMGDYMAGYQSLCSDWSLARAVAASSCFPPVFPPLKPKLRPESLQGGSYPIGGERSRLVRNLQLTDGGVYDNLGIEPIWGKNGPGTILVSDGGGKLWPDSAATFWRRLSRYTSVIQNQTVSLRKRWLIAAYVSKALAGAYWGVGSSVQRYDEANELGYSTEFAATRIAAIRTDLNGFTTEEMGILENHGYLLADAAIRRHASGLIATPATVTPPVPELLDEQRAASALRDSHLRFSLRRWRRSGA